MAHPMMLEAAAAGLLVIDVQDSLLNLIDQAVVHSTISNIALMIRICQRLGLPILWLEQYPKGLGPTAAKLADLLSPSVQPLAKIEFSCMQAQQFRDALSALNRTQLLVTGMETHVCVLQTVFDLRAAGYTVHVPRDGVLSRHKHDWKTGLSLMAQAGAFVTTTEAALFQLFGKAGGEDFKYFSKLLRELAAEGD